MLDLKDRTTSHIVAVGLLLLTIGDMAAMAVLALMNRDIPAVFTSKFDLLIVAFLGVLTPSPRDNAQPTPVQVVNTPADPVVVEAGPTDDGLDALGYNQLRQLASVAGVSAGSSPTQEALREALRVAGVRAPVVDQAA